MAASSSSGRASAGWVRELRPASLRPPEGQEERPHCCLRSHEGLARLRQLHGAVEGHLAVCRRANRRLIGPNPALQVDLLQLPGRAISCRPAPLHLRRHRLHHSAPETQRARHRTAPSSAGDLRGDDHPRNVNGRRFLATPTETTHQQGAEGRRIRRASGAQLDSRPLAPRHAGRKRSMIARVPRHRAAPHPARRSLAFLDACSRCRRRSSWVSASHHRGVTLFNRRAHHEVILSLTQRFLAFTIATPSQRHAAEVGRRFPPSSSPISGAVREKRGVPWRVSVAYEVEARGPLRRPRRVADLSLVVPARSGRRAARLERLGNTTNAQRHRRLGGRSAAASSSALRDVTCRPMP